MPTWLNVAGISALTAGAIFTVAMLILVWSIAWKGVALWTAARLGHKGWFIALLIVNTAGILEIIYIFAVARKAAPTSVSTSS